MTMVWVDDPGVWVDDKFVTVDGTIITFPTDPVGIDQLTAEGAQVRSRCELYRAGVLIDPDVPILDGEVSYTVSDRVTRRCEVEVLADVIPVFAADPLAPAGSELRLYRGALDHDGTWVEEPLGRFVFDKVDVERESLTAFISGYSYGQVVSDARWESPYVVPSGTQLVDALVEATRSRLPDYLWQDEVDCCGLVRPLLAPVVWGEEVDNDPWEDIRKLGRDAGLDVYFSKQGSLTIQPTPDPSTAAPDWALEAGVSALYLASSRRLQGRRYNVAIVRGETDDDTPPVTAMAEDTDPTSASYVGLYRKPYWMVSGFITTVQQAKDAAAAQLRRLIGLSETVGLRMVAHPKLDYNQTVHLIDPTMRFDGYYLIDEVDIPLGPGESTVTLRRQRQVDDDAV
jgi:hypothetical protein